MHSRPAVRPASSLRPRSFSIVLTYPSSSSSHSWARASAAVVENKAHKSQSTRLSRRMLGDGAKWNQPVADSVSRAVAKHFAKRASRSARVSGVGWVAGYEPQVERCYYRDEVKAHLL